MAAGTTIGLSQVPLVFDVAWASVTNWWSIYRQSRMIKRFTPFYPSKASQHSN
jgi:hypothetical protein